MGGRTAGRTHRFSRSARLRLSLVVVSRLRRPGRGRRPRRDEVPQGVNGGAEGQRPGRRRREAPPLKKVEKVLTSGQRAFRPSRSGRARWVGSLGAARNRMGEGRLRH
ncbi:MAG: hypothetical protein QOG88_1518 [Actinomycetota bacterium]|nr:hypothetical protein [Actinomycetota bacterium]